MGSRTTWAPSQCLRATSSPWATIATTAWTAATGASCPWITCAAGPSSSGGASGKAIPTTTTVACPRARRMWPATSSTPPGISSPAPAGSGPEPSLNSACLRGLPVVLLLAAAPLWSWGDKGHRVVSALALRSLPTGPRAWFAGREDEVADHASDPDHWKQDRKEGPRHFLDMEPYGDPDRLPPVSYTH